MNAFDTGTSALLISVSCTISSYLAFYLAPITLTTIDRFQTPRQRIKDDNSRSVSLPSPVRVIKILMTFHSDSTTDTPYRFASSRNTTMSTNKSTIHALLTAAAIRRRRRGRRTHHDRTRKTITISKHRRTTATRRLLRLLILERQRQRHSRIERRLRQRLAREKGKGGALEAKVTKQDACIYYLSRMLKKARVRARVPDREVRELEGLEGMLEGEGAQVEGAESETEDGKGSESSESSDDSD